MDCVTDAGDVVIVYCADLCWHGVHVTLCSVLEGNEEHVGTQTSISSYRVSSDGGHISVDLPKLGVSGIWEADATPVERTVYEQGARRVYWNCLQPRALVRVRIGDRDLCGLGYAECLTMTIPPWQLPMRQLRWGRFVSPQYSLAWLDWQGPYSTCFAICNGTELMPLTVSETEVAVAGATLRIEAGLPMRSGRLGSTILPGAPAIAKLLPLAVFDVEEHKYRSRGELTAQDRISTGWVIHEVVHWEI